MTNEENFDSTTINNNGDDVYKKIFSQNLKKFMALNNKSQSDLINDLGFDKSAVSSLCNGTRFPRMDNLNVLADYFKINYSDLIENNLHQQNRVIVQDETFNNIFSRNLQYFLMKYNMSQTELAKRIDVATTSVYNWIHGLKTPRMNKIDAMCKIFNCTRSDLITSDAEIDSSIAQIRESNIQPSKNVFYSLEKNKIQKNIQYSKQALKFLNKQDRPTKIRIVNAINRLPSGDVKKLQGTTGYRLRVGDYRIIFDYNGIVLAIEKIDNRGQVYK